MGLDLSVGFGASLRQDDPEAADDLDQRFAGVARVLARHGLAPHVEPSACATWGSQMYGYSGLHYLRRIAAHLDAGLPLPPPGGAGSAQDPVLEAYFEDVQGKRPGLAQRLFGKRPRFARRFDHLIVHSDAEGFYLPQDFPKVLFADDEEVPGGMLGSVPRLLAELERLAVVLGVPDDLHAQSEALWEACEDQGEGEARWEQYGIESFCCVVLREACRASLATGAAVVFH